MLSGSIPLWPGRGMIIRLAAALARLPWLARRAAARQFAPASAQNAAELGQECRIRARFLPLKAGKWPRAASISARIGPEMARKLSKHSVRYRFSWFRSRRCGNCAMIRFGPVINRCTLVAGPINGLAVCDRWVAQ